MRKASTHPAKAGSHWPPAGWIFHTRPSPVVPSPVQRLPSRSNARPLVPGTPAANALARGFTSAFGVSRHTLPPEAASATYRSPCASNAMPEGLQPAAFGMNPTSVSVEPVMRHTGHAAGAAARPVVYRLPAASAVSPSMASGRTTWVVKLTSLADTVEQKSRAQPSATSLAFFMASSLRESLPPLLAGGVKILVEARGDVGREQLLDAHAALRQALLVEVGDERLQGRAAAFDRIVPGHFPRGFDFLDQPGQAHREGVGVV